MHFDGGQNKLANRRLMFASTQFTSLMSEILLSIKVLNASIHTRRNTCLIQKIYQKQTEISFCPCA